ASPSQMIPGGRAISPSLSALASLGCGLGSFQSAPFPRSSRLGGDQPCRFAWWNSVPMLMPLRRNERHVLSWSRSLNLSGHVADQLSQIERPPSPSSEDMQARIAAAKKHIHFDGDLPILWMAVCLCLCLRQTGSDSLDSLGD